MFRRLKARNSAFVMALTGALVSGVFLTSAWQSAPAKAVRGNVPGEWRYWGADAWSTRYSPLDQINASNFASLQIAWQWKVGDLYGVDEYFRSTPLFANGRLFSVAGGKRGAGALNPAPRELLWKWGLAEGIR